MLRCPEIRKHENPETIFKFCKRFDEMCFFATICVLPEFANTLLWFALSVSVCLVGEWYHFSTFLPVFCCFLSYFCGVNSIGWHNVSISHSHRVTWNSASSTRLGRGILLRLHPRPSLQAPRNTMNSSILVPRIPLGEILRIGFWYGRDFFGYRSDQRHHWSRPEKVASVVHVAL